MSAILLEDVCPDEFVKGLQKQVPNGRVPGGFSVHLANPALIQLTRDTDPIRVTALTPGSLRVRVGNAGCELIDALETRVTGLLRDKFPGHRLRTCLTADGSLKLRAPPARSCFQEQEGGGVVESDLEVGYSVVPVMRVPGVWVTPGWFGIVMNTHAAMVIDKAPPEDNNDDDDDTTQMTLPACFRRSVGRPDLEAPNTDDEALTDDDEPFVTQVFRQHAAGPDSTPCPGAAAASEAKRPCVP